MCILNEPVIKVSRTYLFCGKFPDSNRQLTVYANRVSTSSNNAMILPFPLLKELEGKKTDAEEELQFYDISQLGSKLFTALNSCFSLRDPPRAARSLRSIVPVYEVGSYLASKCYSLEDLKRIDSSVFTLAADVEELLRSTYPSGFGFVVCRLKPNLVGEEYEPFAYSHYIDGNELFVPTKHFHKHEEKPQETSPYVTPEGSPGPVGARKPLQSRSPSPDDIDGRESPKLTVFRGARAGRDRSPSPVEILPARAPLPRTAGSPVNIVEIKRGQQRHPVKMVSIDGEFDPSTCADWDHDIFLYNYQGGLPEWINSEHWDWNNQTPAELVQLGELCSFSLVNTHSFKKVTVRGDYPNVDLMVSAH